MHCPNCDAEIVKEAAFCPKCGAKIQKPDSRNHAPNANITSSGDSGPAFLSTTKGKAILFGGIAALVFAGLIACLWLFSSGNTIVDPGPPSGPNSSFAVGDRVTDTLSDSEWVTNDGYEIASVIENNRQEFEESGDRYCTINSTVEYENGSLKATKRVNETFKMQRGNGEWVKVDTVEDGKTAVTPIKGVDSGLVKNSAPTLIEFADKNPKKDANGYAVLLRDCYKAGTAFEVKENKTTAEGGDVVVSLHASRGFADYSGTLTASFTWDGKSWILDSCKADDAAYQADYSSLVGTWNGEFLKTEHNNVMDQAACYGGKNHPAVMTIKSVDSNAKTATADISMLVHDHDVPENAAEESAGDTYVTREGVLFPIDPDSEVRIYQSDSPTSFSIYLSLDEGTMNMRTTVDFSFTGGQGHGVAWRKDYYKMVKQGG